MLLYIIPKRLQQLWFTAAVIYAINFYNPFIGNILMVCYIINTMVYHPAI